MANHLFCFGLGYSATALAQTLVPEGWKISGTSRDETGVEGLREKGFAGYLFDGTQALPEETFNDVTHILLSVPPNDEGDPVFATHKALFAAFPKALSKLEWIGYLSTTGVYGDRQGGWVDETSLLAPSTRRGEKRVMAEAQWMSLFKQNYLPLNIFRLAGIYGPGSNQLEKVRSGKARRRVKPGQVFSRIHVDDIVGILRAAMVRGQDGEVYNVCDDEAAPPQDVVTYAAELLDVEPPPAVPFDPEGMTPMGLSFFAESKKVSNQKIKEQLGYALKFPTYREGLKALASTLGQGK